MTSSAYQPGGKEVSLASSFLNEHPELTIIYDVGANKGEWTDGVRRSINHKLDFYLFDPVTYQEGKRLNLCHYATNFTVVLSDENKEVDWYDRGSRGSGYGASYYKEVTPQYKNIKPIKKQARTLDSMVSEHSLPTPHFIKIDTQGSEIDILKGATETIKNVNYIQLEVCRSGKILQHGAPSYENCIEYMKSIGFEKHLDNGKEKEEKPDHDILFRRVIIK
jgi:FkbM family methyltransferase